MLLVPPIEINVECHDASGDHARDQGPVEEKEQKNSEFQREFLNYLRRTLGWRLIHE